MKTQMNLAKFNAEISLNKTNKQYFMSRQPLSLAVNVIPAISLNSPSFVQGSTISSKRISQGPIGPGGGGGLGVGGGCRFEFKCYDCTRCFPFTDYCFNSTCCGLVAVDCDIHV